jgi:H+-transporting ATPase
VNEANLTDSPQAAAVLLEAGAAAAPPTEALGLSEAEAARRLAEFGENALPETRVSALLRLLSYFWGPIPWMIEIAALLSAAVRHWADFAIIFAMLVLNAGVGF